MNHQPPSTTPRPPLPPPSPTTTTGDCGNCGAHVATFLFNVRLRGIHRRVCTKCVLKLHPSSFCPVCFAFYDSSPPHPSKRQACSQCSSFTHSHCATSPPSPYLCRLCSPSSSITLMNDMSSSSPKRIDDKSAAIVLCAAKIASSSMAKAVTVARNEAEKKVRDAALARKKAREALERVGVLITKNSNQNNNNNKNNNNKDSGSVLQASGSESFFNAVAKKESLSQDFINTSQTPNKQGLFANKVKPEWNGIN
ncbi:dna-binding protein [Citrus sinensis]|uniref:uncharacterized protein LOC102628842 isoform X1 n=1 Tax=Citrus sinensis TaxID=2711 RepID=UPI0003D75E45|nr:uncharacterized protein LOC102628842 isoform X1 [Citrus sinensis]KAH9670281.1 dna-binding protein [Citrus sinensis]